MFQIRECNIEDIEAIYELSRSQMGYDVPMAIIAERLALILQREEDKIFVAVIDNCVVGYVHACNYESLYLPPYKSIMGLAVAADCKRQGIGSALLSTVENWAKETGAFGIRLVSGEERAGAHEFYKHCGYEQGKKQIRFKKEW